jgi:hypothetical protein
LYVYTTLNNLGGLINSSPLFSNRPVSIICSGQSFCYNHGAYDLEGDSLSFEVIYPRIGPLPDDTVKYFPGYGPMSPVIGSQPMIFNNLTGEFCIFPQQQDVTVLAILVNEYRDGVLIGQVERDLEIIVDACSNNLPTLIGFNGDSLFNATACVGQEKCFMITAVDPDTANTTFLSWDNSIDGAAFTTLGGHRDSAFFCWTPTMADSSSTPYCFTVKANDDDCPNRGTQVRTYCITVDPSPSCKNVSSELIKTEKVNWKIYPVPATNTLHIDFENDFIKFKNFKIRIENMFGEIVYQSQIIEESKTIAINKWASGIHFLYMVDENDRIIKAEKIIVIK